jgi:hypothetical protein
MYLRIKYKFLIKLYAFEYNFSFPNFFPCLNGPIHSTIFAPNEPITIQPQSRRKRLPPRSNGNMELGHF